MPTADKIPPKSQIEDERKFHMSPPDRLLEAATEFSEAWERCVTEKSNPIDNESLSAAMENLRDAMNEMHAAKARGRSGRRAAFG